MSTVLRKKVPVRRDTTAPFHPPKRYVSVGITVSMDRAYRVHWDTFAWVCSNPPPSALPVITVPLVGRRLPATMGIRAHLGRLSKPYVSWVPIVRIPSLHQWCALLVITVQLAVHSPIRVRWGTTVPFPMYPGRVLRREPTAHSGPLWSACAHPDTTVIVPTLPLYATARSTVQKDPPILIESVQWGASAAQLGVSSVQTVPIVHLDRLTHWIVRWDTIAPPLLSWSCVPIRATVLPRLLSSNPASTHSTA